MKISNHSIALIFATTLLLVSCINIENPPINQDDIRDCHHELTWDKENTKETLIGEWEWEFISCFWNPEDANDDEFEGMTIEFKSDNTLEVKDDGQITQISNWEVINADANLFALDIEPRVPQLGGRILFCDERVEFNQSYIDECDNFFKRKERKE